MPRNPKTGRWCSQAALDALAAQEKPDMPTLIFVYGTLKSGFSNNRLLTGLQPRNAITVDPFVMQSAGIPFMVQPADGIKGAPARVHGEVYECNDAYVASLDRLEGYHPSQHGRCCYNRMPIKVELDSGEVVEAQAYVVLRNAAPPYINKQQLTDGFVVWTPDWMDKLSKRFTEAEDEENAED